MARKLRRYKFKGLHELTKEQVSIINGMHQYLPQTPYELDFKDNLRRALEPLFRVDLDLWWEGTRFVEPGELRQVTRNPMCMGVLGLPPSEHKILIDFDLTLAQRCVDAMLGGAGEDVDSQRELSDIEDGVLSFLLLKILSVLQGEYETEMQLGVQMEKLIRSTATHPFSMLDKQPWACVTLKVFFDVHIGYCRIYLPLELIQGLNNAVPTEGPALERLLRWREQRLDRVAAVRAPISVRAGQISLSAPDLEQLEAGDIILLENSDITLSNGTLEGQVDSYFGMGLHGLIKGTLMVGESGKYEVAIDQIVGLEEPAENGRIVEEGDVMHEEHSERLADATQKISSDAARRIHHNRRKRILNETNLESHQIDNSADDDRFQEHSDSELDEETDGQYSDEYQDAHDEYEAPLQESAGMLNDVNVPMVVEIGRVNVSAADIVGLRPGHVIELSRSPGDSVDLVVSGKRIGKGELVEIEGELGVRILSLLQS